MEKGIYLKRKKKDGQEQWEKVMHWMKSYQIRKWFEKHLAGMKGKAEDAHYIVSKALLEELIVDCMNVLTYPENAREVLPTKAGENYNVGYFDELAGTVEIVDRIIEETDWETEEVSYYECE